VHLNEFNKYILSIHVPGVAHVVGAVGVEILDFHYWILALRLFAGKGGSTAARSAAG
jgi:hypothetical protein